MQPRHRRAVANSLSLMAGIAGLLAMSGCTAVPALNMAASLLKPTPSAQSGLPSQDMVTALAQKLGITLPSQQAAVDPATGQPAAPASAVPAITATAAK